jgi:two-component system, sensor histidine kinase
MPDADEVDQRVLILPATRRDGEVTRAIFERAGLRCQVCAGARMLAAEMGTGVGTILLTDAILSDPQGPELISALGRQPTWSDVPIVLVSHAGRATSQAPILASLTNVTLLDRPTSARTLISAVQAGLRTRMRQYQIRNQILSLQQAEDALRSADRRKDEFLAMLAHELRNPLAPILSASELLEKSLPAEGQTRTMLQIVKRQAGHLTRLVDDLLDVSRITQGRIQLQRKPLQVSSIVAEALESAGPLLKRKKSRVIVNTSAEQLYVDGDSARLVQCLTNVLSNAAKYTDPGGEIRVETLREGASLLMAVTDDGMGISKELLPRIFDLFVQSERSLDRAQGGLGVGLSVVKGLLEMHDGRISAYSAGPGCGSRFEIRLPLIEPPVEVVTTPPRQGAESMRILVVDDNVDAAESLALLLRLDGHSVRTAYTASAALEQASSLQSDVVLLDIGLPEMDGYQVARRIRATGSRARLVALTGYGQAEDIKRGRAAGFDAHLLKPVDLPALNEILVSQRPRQGRHNGHMAEN